MVAWWYKFTSHFDTIKIIQKHSKIYSDVLFVPYFRVFGKLTLFDINIHYAQQITRYRREHMRRGFAATRRCSKFHCVKRILILLRILICRAAPEFCRNMSDLVCIFRLIQWTMLHTHDARANNWIYWNDKIFFYHIPPKWRPLCYMQTIGKYYWIYNSYN